MTAQETRSLVNAALADPKVGLAIPLGMSLVLREGPRTKVLATLNRGDYHPGVSDVPGSVTCRDGGQVRVISLSLESALVAAGPTALPGTNPLQEQLGHLGQCRFQGDAHHAPGTATKA